MTKKKITAGKPADDPICMQDLWEMFVPWWRWFAFSLLMTLVAAVLYLLSTPNIYTRITTILMKDDSKGGTSTNASNELSDLDILRSNTDINNELLTLKSPTLMTKVVQRLGLSEACTVRKRLKVVESYKGPSTVPYTRLRAHETS